MCGKSLTSQDSNIVAILCLLSHHLYMVYLRYTVRDFITFFIKFIILLLGNIKLLFSVSNTFFNHNTFF